jgi:hypothetical protein
MYVSHLLCVLDTSCHFQRAGLDLLTTPPPYSQTGRLTDSVWGGGLGSGGGATTPSCDRLIG